MTEVVAVNETTRAQGRFIVNKLIQPNTPTLIDAVEMPPVDYKVKGEIDCMTPAPPTLTNLLNPLCF